MIHKFSDYLTIDDGVSFEDLFSFSPYLDFLKLNNDPFEYQQPNLLPTFKDFDEGYRIKIQDKWYDSIPIRTLLHNKNEDGYIRAIYIWINYDSGEYYIGKVNASTEKRLISYTGSGVKFKPKYAKHKDRFARYFIFQCKSSEESERVESEIVNEELLKDPFCLNIVKGGGGVSAAPYTSDRRKKQSDYMKSHPERYKTMMEAVSNFTLIDIQKRGASIKKTMSSDKYKKMMSKRIKDWQQSHPKEYALARQRNKEAQQNPAVKAKRVENLKKWKKEHPEEFAIWEQNRMKALADPEHKKRLRNSQKEWIKKHPKEAMERQEKSRKAIVEKRSIPVEMLGLKDGSVIKTFPSIKEAGNWLVANGYTKGTNPSSQICAVCLKKKVPGHGTKKSYLGYGWRYKE